MNMKTYLIESGRTAAGTMHTSLVAPGYVLKKLLDFNLFASYLDQVKKCLFYKRDTLVETTTDERFSDEVVLDHLPTDLVHALLGILSEAGELGELLEEAIRTGQPIDPKALKDESGDLMWYLAMLFRQQGTSFEEVGGLNIDKLRVRFPDKFTYETVNNKDHAAEDKVFDVEEVESFLMPPNVHDYPPELRKLIFQQEWVYTEQGIQMGRTEDVPLAKFGQTIVKLSSGNFVIKDEPPEGMTPVCDRGDHEV